MFKQYKIAKNIRQPMMDLLPVTVLSGFPEAGKTITKKV